MVSLDPCSPPHLVGPGLVFVIEVAAIAEKIVETDVRQFGHARRRPIGALVRKVNQMDDSSTKRDIGRQGRLTIIIWNH